MTNYQVSITVTGYDKASGPLGSVGGALGSMGKIAGGILGANVLMAVGRQIVDLGRQALDSYANYERLGMALQSLVAREMVNTGQAVNLASAMDAAGGKAKDLQGWIAKLAIQSPFTQEDIAGSFRMAMAYGFTADESKRLTTAMTDFAAGSGASGDVMNRIALAMGQIKAKGKLAGQEMLQLTEAGLPVRDILAKAFNVTTEELVAMQEKGLIPADKAIEAITKSLETDFGGAAKRQATTFSGLRSSLEDIKSVGLRTFFEGTFKTIQPYLEKFVDKFSDPAFMESLGKMGEVLGGFVGNSIVGLQKLQGVFEGLKNSSFIQSVATNFKKVFDVLTNPSIMADAQRVFDGIKEFLKDLGAKVIPWATKMFDKLGDWFTENGPLITHYVDVISDRFTNYFLPALMTLWNVAEPILSGILDLILGLAKMAMQIATGDWKGAWDTFVEIVKGVGASLWEAFVALLDGIANIMGTSLAEIGATWSANWEAFKQILFGIGNQISTNWTNNWNLLGQIVSQVWSIIVATVSSAWQSVVSIVTSFIARVGGVLAGWGASISGAVTTAWSTVNGIVRNAWDQLISTIQGFLGGVVSAVQNIFQGVVDKASSFVSQFTNIGSRIMQGLTNGIKSGASSVISSITGAISSAIATAQSALGIASPSKVFAKIGSFMMQGLANGIKATASLPQLAVDNVLGNFGGMQTGSQINSNQYSSADNSQKYYAPVTYLVQQPEASVAGMLRGLQTRTA